MGPRMRSRPEGQQGVPELRHGGLAPRRILFSAFMIKASSSPGNVTLGTLRGRDRRFVLMLQHHAHHVLGAKGHRPRHQLVGEHAKGIDVRSVVDGVSARLLWGHVIRCSHHHAHLRDAPAFSRPAGLGDLGDSKVQHLHQVRPVVPGHDHDVFCLEVAVDNSLGMRGEQGTADLKEDGNGPGTGRAPSRARMVLRFSPDSASITKKNAPSGVWPKSVTLTMFSWPICPAAIASCWQPVDHFLVVRKVGLEDLHRHLAPKQHVLRKEHVPHAARPNQPFD